MKRSTLISQIFPFAGFRSRTPGPPFSLMNWMTAASNWWRWGACRMMARWLRMSGV